MTAGPATKGSLMKICLHEYRAPKCTLRYVILLPEAPYHWRPTKQSPTSLGGLLEIPYIMSLLGTWDRDVCTLPYEVPRFAQCAFQFPLIHLAVNYVLALIQCLS